MRAHGPHASGADRDGVRRRGGDESGLTLVELVVTLAVVAVVVALSAGLVVGIEQANTDVGLSVQAVRQSSLADQSLVQYLEGAESVTSASATSVTVTTAVGFDRTTLAGGAIPLTATWRAPQGPGQDATFVVQYDAGTPRARLVATYDAYAAQSGPVFTYYEYGADGQLVALPIVPVPACALSKVVAIGIHVTFLAGPQAPTPGFAADLPTTLQTTVYLHGLSGAPPPSTTTTSTSCPE